MTFGGKGYWEVIGKVSASGAESLIGTALDEGVNMIDTADVYSEGESEKHVGAALAALDRPRDEILVATKVRLRTGPGPNAVGLSHKHILDSIDASLKRLKLDYMISTRSTAKASAHPSKRPCGHSTTSCAAARCAISVTVIRWHGRR